MGQFFRKMIIVMISVMILLSSPALAVEESLYQLVMGLYEGSYIQFMIFNFGYAPIVTLEPNTKVYSSSALESNAVITIIPDAGTLLIALKCASQGANSSALLYELKDGNLEKLGYVREYDIEVLEIQIEID